MMTEKGEALRALIDHLEKGHGVDKIPGVLIHDSLGLDHVATFMIALDDADMRAFGAAKALHEAVLPGWSGEARFSGYGGGQAAVWNPGKAPHHGGTIRIDNAGPARAWLLAILRALLSMEGGE